MFFVDSLESLNIPQLDHLVVNPLAKQQSLFSTEPVLNALPPSLSKEQLDDMILQLEADATTQSYAQAGTSLGTVEFFVNPAIKHFKGDEAQAAGIVTDLTGTDLADAKLDTEGITNLINPELDTIRINAGGETYIDELGQTWLADQYFSDGLTADTNSHTASTNSDISGTQRDVLYQSERYAKNMSYDIPVANGIYDVNLHFAEIFWSDEGKRLFDISIEGETVSHHLDIYAQTGKNQALQQGFQSIVVTDGQLNLDLHVIADNAQLSALEIVTQQLTEDASEPPLGSPEPHSQSQTSQSQTNIRYISPHGSGDGSSWENAASILDLDTLIEQSAPGDEIWIAGDLGTYNIADQIIRIDSGGSAIAPIHIRGVASQVGGNDTPLFVGDRAEDWTPGKANGHEVFRLLNGANYLHFSDLDFQNVGNGAFRLGGDLTGITLEDMDANNVRRFVENSASEGASTASVTDLTIRDVEVHGFSKSVIHLQYNTHNVLIEDVLGDSQGQDGDNFAMGVHLSGSVNNVVHRRVTMNNAIQTKDEDSYWNADGFVSEKDTYNITYEDTYAAGNTDGGYDLKSHNTLLIRAGAADNKRNFRIWGSAAMYDIVSDDPLRKGGTGTDAHIHVLGNGTLTIEDGTFTGDKSIDNIIFDLDDQGSLVVNGAIITDNLYTLHTVQNGSIQLEQVLEK